MHKEYYEVSPSAAALLNETRNRGRQVIGVGTTVVRTLETVYEPGKGYVPGHGETDKFIYPGYEFRGVDQIITNFHLPGSSLLMMISAFGGIAKVKEAYAYAIAQKYRFFSYGDAMLIR
jgi:S-adenosylmethionine:tRNA ribosyltransferase-isomerase